MQRRLRETLAVMQRVPILLSVAAIVFAAAVGLARPTAGQPAPAGSPLTIEGAVVMSVEDDFQTGRATRRYFLNHSGRHFDLVLTPGQAAGLQPGMTVRITGWLAGRVLTADPSDESVVVLHPAPR